MWEPEHQKQQESPLVQASIDFMPPEHIGQESDLSTLNWKDAVATASILASSILSNNYSFFSGAKRIDGQSAEVGDYVIKYHNQENSILHSYFNLSTPRLILPRSYFKEHATHRGDDGYRIQEYELTVPVQATQIELPFSWQTRDNIMEAGSLMLIHNFGEDRQGIEVWPAGWKKESGRDAFTAAVRWVS